MNNDKKNYVTYHLHSSLSLLDSCTDYHDYIDKAVELGQKAICFSEHGNIFNWVSKKVACDKAGIKYIHGCEVYLTASLEPKIRDNYHTVLIAKNKSGLKELNQLISTANEKGHFYFKPRISFNEFFNISNNVIKISACLMSPLNKYNLDDDILKELLKKYDYYEIQPHIMSEEQKKYNKKLFEYSKKYNKPLIAGTDTHSLNKYKAECRSILQLAKGIEYADEDTFDLTYKSYDELVEMFEKQDSLPKSVYLQAIENTNRMADSCEDVILDTEFKYPKVYDDDIKEIKLRINKGFKQKFDDGIIPLEQKEEFIIHLREELEVFEKINMCGFMLFMSDLITWCHSNNIPTGISRGSCGGSCIAYILDIIDMNPITWKTVFSRFANENRKELGDIDVDFAPNDREKVYNHMIETFGEKYTAYILAIGTVSDKGCIDEIGRALSRRNPENKIFSLSNIKIVKDEYEKDPERVKETYPKIFYYFDGMINTPISQSIHPCGMVVSPITLEDNYGTFYGKEDKKTLQIDMENIHEVSLVKYDILGLKNIGIIKDACDSAGISYIKSNEINWNDKDVWNDMLKCPQGIFQFEGDFAFQMLCQYKPKNIFDMSLITAALRPSGASYRNELMAKIPHKNPSTIIDDLLKDNYGYLVYQEDIIKFLQEICGLSGSDADNVRRAIARKQADRMEAALPGILDGYCKVSNKERNIAEKEAQEFIKIIEDASSYMFGYNHSVGYCMIGYICAYLRYYYKSDFIVSYLNNADNENDIVNGFKIARMYNINILPPRFRHSRDRYVLDKETGDIYKGIASIKFLNSGASEYLYSLRNNHYDSFIQLLNEIINSNQINSRQLEILIRLQYFEEFGKNKKLVEIYYMFKNLYGRKMIAKDKIDKYDFDEELLKKYSSKETPKLYMDIDSISMINEMSDIIPNESFSIQEQVSFEMETLGYISMTYDVDKRICYVIDIDTKYSPKITLYSLKNGNQIVCKINKNVFKKSPLKKGNLINAVKFEKRFKQHMTATGWERSNELEWWLDAYYITALEGDK